MLTAPVACCMVFSSVSITSGTGVCAWYQYHCNARIEDCRSELLFDAPFRRSDRTVSLTAALCAAHRHECCRHPFLFFFFFFSFHFISFIIVSAAVVAIRVVAIRVVDVDVLIGSAREGRRIGSLPPPDHSTADRDGE